MAGPYTSFKYGDPKITSYSSNPQIDPLEAFPKKFVMGLTVTGSSGGGASIPVMWGEQLESGTIGISYSETITASGGTTPYTFSLASGSLPTGLSLSSSGVISGTPTTAGTYTFAVNVTDSASPIANSNTQTFQIIVPSPSASGGGSYVFG